jgi:23S rRNA pseudouridine1911/1915/1917 synthase
MIDPAVRLDVILPPETAGERLDRALAQAVPDLSRTRIQALLRAGKVTLDGKPVSGLGAKVLGGETAQIEIPPPEPAEPEAEAIPLTVVYEDDELIVIDKPAGLVVHPGAGNWTGTLVNALLAHCAGSLSGIGGVERPGIVHRLDKDTTGLLVAAKTDRAHRSLADQFADHGRTGPLERAYLAVLWGAPSRPRGTVDAPLDRDPRNREKIHVCKPERGREAITHWETVESYGPKAAPVATLVRCVLETGRTHQIRVHMAHLGHPVMGDPTYGSGFKSKIRHLPQEAQDILAGLGRQALHAAHLAFEHPATGELMTFDSELPEDLARLVAALETAA